MTDISDMRASVGHEPSSGLYYEILGDGTSYPHPILFIHGGGGNGAGWRRSLDGRAGWADLLAADGYECWVTDWPGSGRSAYRDYETLEYADAVDGYIRLLRDVIGRPVVIVPHSMGGAITWRLVEEVPELVAGVVGIAAAYPANIQRRSEVTSDDGTHVELTFADTGVVFRVDRTRPYVYSREYMEKQAGGDGPLIDPEWREGMLRHPGAMAPRLLLQRVGVLDGMPVIEDTTGFQGKTVRLVAGDHDLAHTREIENRTVELLRSWGADARLVWLADEGLPGHSHWLTRERNYQDVLAVVRRQFEEMRHPV
ncbi:alpha/beta hydrolase family protein [Blastococcus sp. SYSU D00820]